MEIRTEKHGQTAVLRMVECPEEPGLSPADLDALPIAIRELSRTELKFLVFAGANGVFCRGGSTNLIQTMSATPFEQRDSFVARVQAVVWEVLCSPLMTVAAVNGLAAGPGADVALACDITLAGPAARINMWYNRLGLVPDMGLFLLADTLGYKKALHACATSSVWLQDHLVDLGLAERMDEEPLSAENWHSFLTRRYRHSSMGHAATKRIRLEACRAQWEAEMKLARKEQSNMLSDPELKSRLDRTAAFQSMNTLPRENNSKRVNA